MRDLKDKIVFAAAAAAMAVFAVQALPGAPRAQEAAKQAAPAAAQAQQQQAQAEAEDFDPDTVYDLGVQYYNSEIMWEKVQGVALIMRAAGKGHPNAQFATAQIYMDGTMLLPDYQYAAVLLEQAGQQGLVPADLYLGAMHALGRGMRKNQSSALTYLGRAAMSDETYARSIYDPMVALVNNGTLTRESYDQFLFQTLDYAQQQYKQGWFGPTSKPRSDVDIARAMQEQTKILENLKQQAPRQQARQPAPQQAAPRQAAPRTSQGLESPTSKKSQAYRNPRVREIAEERRAREEAMRARAEALRRAQQQTLQQQQRTQPQQQQQQQQGGIFSGGEDSGYEGVFSGGGESSGGGSVLTPSLGGQEGTTGGYIVVPPAQ